MFYCRTICKYTGEKRFFNPRMGQFSLPNPEEYREGYFGLPEDGYPAPWLPLGALEQIPLMALAVLIDHSFGLGIAQSADSLPGAEWKVQPARKEDEAGRAWCGILM